MNNKSTSRFDFVVNSELGEQKIDREDEIIDELVKLFTEHFRRHYQKRTAQRAVHAKSHGCLKGTFEVFDHGDPDFGIGVFSKPGKYESYVRFSNGDGPAGSDKAKIASVGLGIKLLGVGIPKLLPAQDEDSQDFLMINQPKFIVSDIRGFQRIIEGREGGLLKKAAAFFHHRRGIFFRRSASPKDNPLNTNYWSVTPFQLGDHAVKYMARPSEPELPVDPGRLSENYLRELVKERIEKKEVCFDFFLQKRLIDGKEDKEMPVEDNAVTWDEKKAKPILVGKLTLPAQSVDALDEDEFCENIVFSPWNTSKGFRPMSSLNRARKVIYEFSARRRHEMNGAENPLASRREDAS